MSDDADSSKAAKRNRTKCDPPKIGDIVECSGVQVVVQDVTLSRGGHLWCIKSSPEPLAIQRGFATWDECCGFKIEHHAPEFVPVGTPRDRMKLTEVDWDFSALLKEKPEIKAVALFHELARESARVRNACYIFAHPPKCLIEEEDARKKEWEAAKRGDKIESKRWGQKREKLRMGPEGWHERQRWDNARKFLDHLEAKFPRGAKELMADWVGEDKPWNSITSELRDKGLAILDEAVKDNRDRREGLVMKDVQPEAGTAWPFDAAIEFPREHHKDGRPKYSVNRGIPGLPVMARLGNGSDAERIVTECFEIEGIKNLCDKIELCVRWNYRDDDIIEEFDLWLKSHRNPKDNKKPLLKPRERKARTAEFAEFIKKERDALPDGLADFRESKSQTSVRLKSDRVDKGLRALAALRLVCCQGLKVGANTFKDIYPASAERTKRGKKDDVPKANVWNLAKEAERLQREFFRYCPFDSAKQPELKRGPWDHLCTLCTEHVYPIGSEPKKGNSQWHEEEFRCPKCDHRETMQWNGTSWFAVEWRDSEWRPV